MKELVWGRGISSISIISMKEFVLLVVTSISSISMSS